MTHDATTMKAYQLTGHGGSDMLVYNDNAPRPKPQPDEVLIEVTACGMNNTDLKVREGAYNVDFDPNSDKDESESTASISNIDGQTSLNFPRIQGADIVGHVVAVGRNVSPDRIGERVLVDFSIYNGRDKNGAPCMDYANVDYIGHGRDGGYAEYVCVPSSNAHYVDTDIPDAALASFGCSTLTAEHMVDKTGVKKGQYVFVTGAGGGVGSAALQLVKARGAIPVALTSRGKEDQLAQFDVQHFLLRQDFAAPDGAFDSDRFLARALAVTGGHRFDVVIDQVGGAMFHALLQALKPEGHYVTAGTIAGYTPVLNMHTLYMKGLHLHGSSQGQPSDFARIIDYIESGKLKPTLAGAFKLSELKTAQETFAQKQFFGKIVIVPDRHWDEHGKPYAL